MMHSATRAVISASPRLGPVVEKMLEHRISVVPIVDQNRVVGVLSEGDLMNRRETQTVRTRSWWLDLFVGSEERAAGFLKTRGTRAGDVMTAPAITPTEDETAAEIARKLHVTDDAVELWGLVDSPGQIAVARAAVEDAAPSKALENQLSVRPHFNQFD